MKHKTLAGIAALLVSLMFGGVAHAQDATQLDTSLATQSNPMTIVLDAQKAPIGLAYAHMTIPVKPGPFTLDYPQWIPGEHGPTGPLNDMSELKISANGTNIPWSRDQVDMYAFHIDVPQGVTSVNVDFTVLLNGGGTFATQNIMVGNWNRYLLYQRNIDNTQYFVKASIIMPQGWDYASALPLGNRSGNRVDFDTVSLEMLVDSPTDMGRFVKHINTWTGADGTKTYLDLFGDQPEDLDISDNVIAKYKNLTPEAMALYGGRHWNVYHAELTLSDAIGFQGIEHHQSSDDRANDAFMTNPRSQMLQGDLIPHEFSHSWNGKYRRPFDLQQPDYNDPHPEHDELLWVYEGMNQYMGDLLSFRSGIRDPEDYPEYFASIWARMAYETGRNTTPIIDTTTEAPSLYQIGGAYSNIRRTSGDFYTEGELMWFDADTIIREQTHGAKSLDDYLHIFAGGVSGPMVKTYTREDIEGYLNQVAPYDWHGFFQKYVYSIAPTPPEDSIARAGYKLVFNDTPNKFNRTPVNSWYDVGVNIGGTGRVADVREGSVAWNAGMAAGMEILAVNNRAFNPELFIQALKDAKGKTEPIHLLVKQGDFTQLVDLDYHDGPKYPHLERLPGTTDMFADIARPHAGTAAAH